MCKLGSPNQRTQPYHRRPTSSSLRLAGWRYFVEIWSWLPAWESPSSHLLPDGWFRSARQCCQSLGSATASSSKILLACARFLFIVTKLPGQVLILLAKLDCALHSSEILLAEQRNTRVELLSCGFLLGHAESLESSCLPATDNISMQVQNILRLKFEQRLSTLCVFSNALLGDLGQISCSMFQTMHGKTKQRLNLLVLQGLEF